MTSYDGYGRADLLARIAELEKALRDAMDLSNQAELRFLGSSIAYDPIERLAIWIRLEEVLENVHPRTKGVVARRKGAQKLEPLHPSSTIMVGQCLRCGARCELNDEEQCIMGCARLSEGSPNIAIADVAREVARRLETGEPMLQETAPDVLRKMAELYEKAWRVLDGRRVLDGKSPCPTEATHERVALTSEPDAPFAAMKDAALTDLHVKVDVWPLADRMAVQTLITEVRYLRKKLGERTDYARNEPSSPSPMSSLREHVVRHIEQNRSDRRRGANAFPAIDELEMILNLIDDSSRRNHSEIEPCVPGGVCGRRCTTHGMLPLYPNERCLEGIR